MTFERDLEAGPESEMLFSVIIPTYNRQELLAQTLESVFAQSCRSFEVLVVDDGSTDGTDELLATYGDRVKVIRQTNCGPSVARNRGGELARGRYLAFLDSDDVWFAWTLENYRQAIKSHGEPSFVTGKQVVFTDIRNLESTTATIVRFEAFDDYFASSSAWRWFGVSSFVIRRDVFSQRGGFSTELRHAEDQDMALRIGDAAGFVHVSTPPAFGYRIHQSESGGQLTNISAAEFPAANIVVRRERNAFYPGGSVRSAERRKIISRHVRPVILSLLKRGELKQAWSLYRDTWTWNACQRRWAFVAAVPFLAVWYSARRRSATT
jgi:hypothetical protein